MSQLVVELAKPIKCVSAERSLSEYAQFLTACDEGDTIVLMHARRPACMLTRREFAYCLQQAAEQGLAPIEVFKGQFTKVAILSGQLSLEDLFQRMDEAVFERLQQGCLIAEKTKLLGILDLRALSLYMLQRVKAPSSVTETPSEDAEAPPVPAFQIGTLAHEIRTPLTGITGLAELLSTRIRDKATRNMAASLVRSSRALDRLLTDALDYAALEAGQFEVSTHPCNLMELVNDLQQIWGHEAARRTLSYEVEFWPNGPHQIITDLGRVRQIANNLISNALKFTETGGVSVSLSTQPLKEQLVLMLSVTDTGKGLKLEEQEKFRKAFEKDPAHDQSLGWGLGLSISHALTDKLAGELSYEDNPAGGSVFNLTIPVQSTPMAEIVSTQSERLRRGKFQIGEILLVEDHEASAMIALQILENAGWKVEVVGSLTQAQSCIESTAYQAVITDLHLADGNALNLIERIRRHSPLNAQTPIVAMTADISGARRQECLDAGADRALRKPLNGPELVASLADVLMARAATETVTEAPQSGGFTLCGRLAG